MSYCRWSDDSFRCDVYCYADVSGGYQVWVAQNRLVGPEPRPEVVRSDGAEVFYAQHVALMQWCDAATREQIGLSRDGDGFHVETAGEAADLLESLQAEGYCVPQSAIDMLRAEATEGAV